MELRDGYDIMEEIKITMTNLFLLIETGMHVQII